MNETGKETLNQLKKQVRKKTPEKCTLFVMDAINENNWQPACSEEKYVTRNKNVSLFISHKSTHILMPHCGPFSWYTMRY